MKKIRAVWMRIATAAALNKQFHNEPMKICVTPGLAKSELLSDVGIYLVRVYTVCKTEMRLHEALVRPVMISK